MCASHPKPERIRDEQLKAEVRTQGCVVDNCDCTRGRYNDPDHVKTQGSGGWDVPENLMPLCRFHHVEKGTIGVHTFAAKYGIVFSAETMRWVRTK